MKLSRTTALLLILVFIVALFFRLYRIDTIPFGLNNDAAWEGSATIDILRGNWQPYIPYAAEGWRGEAGIRLLMATIGIFVGPIPLLIRVASTLYGIALIIPLYFCLTQLFSATIALCGTFFVATSGWHIIMGRSGWRAMTVPLVSTLALLFLLIGIKKRSFVGFLFAGIATGLSFYTYDAGRIILVFIIASAVLLVRKYSSSYSKLGMIICACACCITAAPMILYASLHWSNFIGRSDYLFVGHAIEKTGSLTPLIDNIKISLGIFTYRANGNDFFVSEPLMDWPTNYLFILGLIITVWYTLAKRSVSHAILLLWFISGVVPCILSLPNGNRAIGAIPAVYTMAAIAADRLINRISSVVTGFTKQISLILWIMVLLGTSAVTYTIYFGPHRRQPQGFYPETYVTAFYVKPLLSTYDLYFFDNFPHEILTYLLYTSGDPFQKNYTWYYDQKDKISTIVPTQTKGAAIIMFPTEDNRRIANLVKEKYPGTTVKILPLRTNLFHQDAALIILIPHT